MGEVNFTQEEDIRLETTKARLLNVLKRHEALSRRLSRDPDKMIYQHLQREFEAAGSAQTQEDILTGEQSNDGLLATIKEAVYKAEKVELSADSTKGYRTTRATRGVVEGAWYFEIKVVSLGETGHTSLGWITDNGDLQAPVGYDANSYGYRDIDGCKIYKALKEKYGDEGYTEGDIIGFYINLPQGSIYIPKQQNLVMYKGQRYASMPAKEEDPKVVPGSEISFFKNGKCQGTAFLDLFGGCYYPAASMYTLPNQPNCVVKFNFGPDFDFFPDDFGNRPSPKPMNEVPFHGYESKLVFCEEKE